MENVEWQWSRLTVEGTPDHCASVLLPSLKSSSPGVSAAAIPYSHAHSTVNSNNLKQ